MSLLAALRTTALTATLMLTGALVARAQSPEISDSTAYLPVQVVDFTFADGDSLSILGSDTIPAAVPFERFKEYNAWEERDVVFNPDPSRAVWLSALCPGLGQLYNRRYWKLPIVVGAYLGLGYATSWNNRMLTDYQRAYLDIMDSDPGTDSYKDFFRPGATFDEEWLKRILKSRKDYYRRNRDLCIICMVGVYFLAMVDAYVDASLSHFDISPDLSIDWSPSVMPDFHGKMPAIGLSWALNF